MQRLRVSTSSRSTIGASLRPFLHAATLGAVLVAVLATPSGARAQGAPADQGVIEYRQLLMGAVGYNMGAIAGIMKYQLDRPGAVANHARQMAEAAKLVAAAFKQRVVAGKTDAKAEIWQDWAKFEKAIADYDKAASGLATAAAGSDPAATGAAMKALGDSCTGCHESFRKPKEQSYKNR